MLTDTTALFTKCFKTDVSPCHRTSLPPLQTLAYDNSNNPEEIKPAETASLLAATEGTNGHKSAYTHTKQEQTPTHIHIHTYIHTYTHAQTSTRTRTHTHSAHKHAKMHARTHTHTHTHTHTNE